VDALLQSSEADSVEGGAGRDSGEVLVAEQVRCVFDIVRRREHLLEASKTVFLPVHNHRRGA
jgi:hypothetical protein